jgi:hypothetical protein
MILIMHTQTIKDPSELFIDDSNWSKYLRIRTSVFSNVVSTTVSDIPRLGFKSHHRHQCFYTFF